MKEKGTNVITRFIDQIKWFFYDLRVKLFGSRKPSEKNLANSMSSRTRKKIIFLFIFLLFPTVQFLIFYVGVNFNSLLLSIQEYQVVDNRGQYVITGFDNFVKVFENIFINGELLTAIKNSAIQFIVGLVLGIPVHVMVAYVVFKEVPLGGFLKIMLFMPSMISSLVFVSTFRFLVQEGAPIIFEDEMLALLLQGRSYDDFWLILMFAQWMNFSNGLIIYLSAMCSISTDIIEYGQLEPMSTIQELWYVIIPSIFPTITTYLVVSIAGFFTNYGYFVSFFRVNTDGGMSLGGNMFDTLGYVFFVGLLNGDQGLEFYPYASAAGIVFTLIAAPLTLLVKHLLEKYGPSED